MVTYGAQYRVPADFVILRHGQSEANLVQRSDRSFTIPDEFTTRHDSFMRLTPEGARQAQIAGEWLKANRLAGDYFDACLVSPHIRTRETAANLRMGVNWSIEDLLRERDWGEYGAIGRKDEQRRRYPENSAQRDQNFWYWKPVGGESLATGVRSRVERLLDNMRRWRDVDTVLAVSHGEFIRTLQYVLEGLTPDEWLKLDANKDFTIRNCTILHYTSVNPETGARDTFFRWVRQIDPINPKRSPYNGEWRELTFRTYTDDELLESVNEFKHIF